MDALGGPTPIGTNGQVTIAKRILQTLGWSSGDHVVLRVTDDEPGILKVVPEAVALRQLKRGEEAERMMRMTGQAEMPKPSATEPRTE